jgi:osmotically-inducible protein OsmY
MARSVESPNRKPAAPPEYEPEMAMNSATDIPSMVAEQARKQLQGQPYRALKHVSCDYRDGTLTLRGRLPSYFLKQMAQAAVARIAGVERIVNHIEVVAAVCV